MTLTVELPPHVDEAHARLVLAIDLFREGTITVGQAAELAGLSQHAFLDALHERGIPAYTVSEENWAQDLAHIRSEDEAFAKEMETVSRLIQERKERDA